MNGSVLITGGTGSLGHAILSRAERERWDARFTVYSRDEAKQATLADSFPGVRCVLGDVRDGDRLEAAMRGVDTVIHAAAYKRVPEAERQPITCAEANVVGSANVVAAARRIGTPRVIGISTDKACSPINAYGFTKALMERMFAAEALERPDGPAFTTVRYGNVIASRGSVVPMFRAQAARGGPLTLTDPDMTRFWITLDDAVDLILSGLTIPNGHILVPRSRSSSMRVMAEACAPGVSTVTGVNRGGEKRHEQLMNAHESPYSRFELIGFDLAPMGGEPFGLFPEGYEYTSDRAEQYTVDELRAVLTAMDADEPVRTLLHEVVTVRGIPLTVYQHEAVSEVIRQTGDFYEADILDELREMYPEQRIIVDVGANIGNHSAYWSAFVPHTAIHAFEPVPDNYELLRLNAPEAIAHGCALSYRAGSVGITPDRQNMGRSQVARDGEYRVTGRTLDSFHLDDVSLIKIDVEGHEQQVLAGAWWTINHSRPALVVEDEYDQIGEVLRLAEHDGYRRTREWPGHNDLWEWR